MTRGTTGRAEPPEGEPLGSLDPNSVERIDRHLRRAVAAEDCTEKDFHVRHARQLLEACRE